MKRSTTNGSIALALGVGLALVLALFVLSTQAAPPLSEVAGAAASHGTVPNAPAAELHVCPSGCTYSSIQDAVDAASDGDVIKVAAGTYTGVQGRAAPAGYGGPSVITQVVYISRAVTIRGGYTTAFTDPPNPEANPTTLDALGKGRVLFITGNISPTVEGLRITGGDAAGLDGNYQWSDDAGGGVYIITATATISDNYVFSNTADDCGGLFLYNSNATVSSNNISDNSGRGVSLHNSDATLSDNTIAGNIAEDGRGGGLYLASSAATLIGNTVTSNTATIAGYVSEGGGLYLEWSAKATLVNNIVSANTADQGGGLYGGSAVTLSGNTIISNTASRNGGGLYTGGYAMFSGNTISANIASDYGGGLYLAGSIGDDVTLSGNAISANIADRGGGLFLTSGSNVTLISNTVSANAADYDGGGLFLNGDSDATLSGNVVSANTAGYGGGGLFLNGDSDATLSGNVVSANTADRGGGLHLDNSDATLLNNVIADNQADTAGSGLYILSSSPRLLHTTVARNTGGDGSGVHVGSGAVALTNTILVSHTVGITVTAGNTATLESTLWGSGTWANGSDWGGDGAVITGTVSRWGAPAFVDPDNGDYHIGLGSAAVDAGVDAGVTDDMDSQMRPMDWGYDIGADECLGAGLEIVKQPSAVSVNRGVLTYTIAVVSVGTVDATGVVLTDTLDGWQRPITATSSAGGCTVIDGGWGGTVICAPGTLVTGATAWVTLTAQVSTDAAVGQAITNTVVVTANETTNGIQVTNRVHDCHARINDDPTEYTSVQAAVDAASPGDLVKVAGYCLGVNERGGERQQVYLDKSVTIQGGYTTANWTVSDPEADPTTLDALGQGRVLYITGDISPTVEGLRITGGDPGQSADDNCGGGVYVNDAPATIRDSQVYSNTAQGGGGLWLGEGGATLINNTISANTADSGGGLFLSESGATLVDNTISANTATSQGGGLLLTESGATLISNTISANTTSGRGGGLYLAYGSAATLSGNTVSSNTAGSGGGLYVYANATLSGNTISANVADWGGGVSVAWSDATLSGNTITTNTAHNDGGGVHGDGTLIENIISGNTAQGCGGGVQGGGALTGNTIFANTADSGGGLCLGGSAATLSGNTVTSNAANYGGGLYTDRSNATLVNNVIADNRAASQGSGLYVADSSLRLRHTTIARNTDGDGSGVYVSDACYSTVALTNTILVSHTVGIYVVWCNTARLEGTLWGGGTWANATDWGGRGTIITGTVNLWGDPAFVDPDNGDYHIGPGSAAVDAGVDAGVTVDIDGEPRPQGNGYDIGADERPDATLRLHKAVWPLLLNPGQTLTYTLAVASTGVETATGVRLTDTLPALQRAVTITTTWGSCTASAGWGGAATCDLGTMAWGDTAHITLTAQVTATPPAQLPVLMRNSAWVQAAETSNTAYADTTLHNCHVRLNDSPIEYDTVQAAVDASTQPSDVVKVAGTCTGVTDQGGGSQISYLSKTLTLQGGWNTAFTQRDVMSFPTTLDARGQGRVLFITGDISPTVEGLRITGGDATGLGGGHPWGNDVGGGVVIITATATIRDNQVFSNTTTEHGGGLALYYSAATLSGNTVTSNTAIRDGGGLFLHDSDNVTLSGNTVTSNTAGDYGGGLALYYSAATLIDNTISDNTAEDGRGGGLYLAFSAATLIGNTVTSNTATIVVILGSEGGGLYLVGSDNATLVNNIVSANTADRGGGLYVDGSATLIGNIVSSNIANGTGSFHRGGGGLWLSNSEATLSGNIVTSNTAYGTGGGLALWGGDTTLNGNTVTSNIAGAGGGLYLDGADATLSGNAISANIADRGGGLHLDNSDATLINNVVVGNAGSGLYVTDSSVRLAHATIARNGGGVHVTNAWYRSAVALTNTILVSHTVGITVTAGNTATLEGTLWGSGQWANEADWGGGGTVITGTVNVWGDPAFVDPDDGDYHISPGSAAVDAGVDAGVTDDIDGDPRDDGYPDIGADETVGLKCVYLPLVMRGFP